MEKVAVIGAGPAGLVAARFLLGHGFEPTIYEAHERIGGQWDWTNPASGVWPSMRTNTARMVTRFSDLDYAPEIPLFPPATDVAAYLRAYARVSGLEDRIVTGTRLTGVVQLPTGWRLSLQRGGRQTEEDYPRVVIATGAFNCPDAPPVPGLGDFTGECGVIHAFDYKAPGDLAGQRVLVAGGNISALEIASDLAMLGAASVGTTMRRQRYVMPKLIAGTPVESYGFTRAAALRLETADPDEWAAETRAFVLTYGGNPAWFGAPDPDPDVRVAGTTGSQNFLNLVAEGRIRCFPWMKGVAGNTVTFVDGRRIDVDAIILGTGYRLSLPFLSDALRANLGLADGSLTLHERTFHPDTPGLAFMGLWGQIGPYFPVLEAQARYLAYAWAGVIPMPDPDEMRRGCAESAGNGAPDLYQHLETIRYARLAGCDPDETRVSPELAAILGRSAVTSVSLRLVGPDALETAEAQVRADEARYGRKLVETASIGKETTA